MFGSIIRRWRRSLDDVHSFALFVGYPRSGHTVLGAVLNAHPDAVISHELHPLRNDWSRTRLFHAVLDRDDWWKRLGWQWEGWDYLIPGQWQGRYRTLRVLGDKSGGRTSRYVREHPAALTELTNRLGSVRLRMIHHVRNPFDTIATMHRKGQPGVVTLDDAIARYPEHCEGVRIALDSADVLTLDHETLTADPHATIRELCEFVGLAPHADHIDAAARIVHPSARRSRDLVEWTPEQTERVLAIMDRYPFLVQYQPA
ncbi:MAG TPA: sulfotransferase domain-containing protein [Longimicrobiales bacterium]